MTELGMTPAARSRLASNAPIAVGATEPLRIVRVIIDPRAPRIEHAAAVEPN